MEILGWVVVGYIEIVHEGLDYRRYSPEKWEWVVAGYSGPVSFPESLEQKYQKYLSEL